MNMNLWKKIGIDHHTSSDIDDQEVFSSIKKSDTALKNRSLDQNVADLPYNLCTYRSENVSILKDQPCRLQIPNVFDLQFESCQSQPLNSYRPSYPNIPNNHQTPRQTKQQLKSLQLDILLLQQEHSSLQKTFRKDIDFFNNFIQRQFKALLQAITRSTAPATPPSTSFETQTEMSCSCQTHKKMIDSLTKQYWNLQQQLQQKQAENKGLKQQLGTVSTYPYDPLKKIQYGLLQERSETIKKLKQEHLILQEENEQLVNLLEERQRQMQSIEAAHQNTLMELRREIDHIRDTNYACNEKIGTAMDEKYNVESDLAALRSKYNSLERHYENHRREIKSNNAIKLHDVSYSYVREKYNPQDKSVSSNNISEHSREHYPTPKSQHSNNPYPRLDHSSYNKYGLSSQPKTTKADYISQLYRQDFESNLQWSLKEKEKWNNPTNQLSQSNHRKPAENYIAKARIANGFSYERALTNLSQIQRDVRKEINRSKEACR